MATDAMVSLRGYYTGGAYVEFGYARCFNCPFPDCTDANADSIECPRRRAELAQLRADGVIPPGYIVNEELAGKLGVSTRNLRPVLKRLGIPSHIHRVGKLKWRLYATADVGAAIAGVNGC